jgi:3-dehydroquinate dehydratase II
MADTPFIAVLHGVNANMLGKRDPAHYGTLTLLELEEQIAGWAGELGMEVGFMQTNAESQFVEHLHGAKDVYDGLILNPGAWTHYAWAIHDALEIAALPAVEVHLSDVKAREAWRAVSVVEDLCLLSVCGKGPKGYRLALERLRQELS